MSRTESSAEPPGLWQRLQQRGVIRVALGYAVIGWLLLQIGDVVLEPLDAPVWLMRALIVAVVTGFPVALVLAWFLELGPKGITVDRLPEGAARPTVRGIRRYADLVIIVTLLGIIAVLLARQEGLLEPEPEQPVLAVLPFEEIGKDEIGYFGAGLADTLSGKLGELQELIVLASSSTREFSGQNRDPVAIGAKLGATALLIGSVQRAGGLLRVNARLVDPRSGQQLWTQSYDRDAKDLFAVQDDIAHAVTRSLAVILTPEQSQRLAQEPTSQLGAYEAYLRAMDDLASRDHQRITSGLRYLRDAIKLDPDYALAHAALPYALFLAASYSRWDTRWEEIRDEAMQAAERAVLLDPRSGESWFAQAMVLVGDYEWGQQNRDVSLETLVGLLEKALELSPNDSRIIRQLALFSEDPLQQVALLKRAARVDPRAGIIRVNIAEILSGEAQYETAERWLVEAASTQDPYFQMAYKALAGLDLYHYRQLDRSARWARAYYQRYPEDWAAMIEYTRALLELGAWEELDGVLDHIRKMDPLGEAEYWVLQLMQARSIRAQGRFEELLEPARAYVREQLITMPVWPDASQLQSTLLTPLEAEALAEIMSGEHEGTLQRYLEIYPNPKSADLGGAYSDFFRTPVMIAALHRLNGQEQQAEALLRSSLVRIDTQDGMPQRKLDPLGFTRFTILALLGETEAAIEELQKVVESGWVVQWWGLKDAAAFDTNYAAVVADPRFEELYSGLIDRVTAMRESFRTNPELPEETLQAAGLSLKSN